VIAEYREVLQLALTAGVGDLSTAGLLVARRRLTGGRDPLALEDPPPALASLLGMKWETLSQLLVWAWDYLGFEVEVSDTAGPVDFILTDTAGYTYVQARGWRRREVTTSDIESLRAAMEIVGVDRGFVMSCGWLATSTEDFARRCGIRVIGGEELAVMIDLLRSAPTKMLPAEGSDHRLN